LRGRCVSAAVLVLSAPAHLVLGSSRRGRRGDDVSAPQKGIDRTLQQQSREIAALKQELASLRALLPSRAPHKSSSQP
jgi:hypothetical protein